MQKGTYTVKWVVVALAMIGLVVAGDEASLRSRELNFDIAEALRGRFNDDIVAQNAVAIKYGGFGPLSWANATSNSTNSANINAIIGALMQVYAASTENFTYTEHVAPFPDTTATGLSNVAIGLTYSAVVGGKLYSQRHLIGDISVEQTSLGKKNTTYRVGASVDVTDLVFKGAGYAVSPAQLTRVTIQGWRYHTYVRVTDNDEVNFLIDAVDGYAMYNFVEAGSITAYANSKPYTTADFAA